MWGVELKNEVRVGSVLVGGGGDGMMDEVKVLSGVYVSTYVLTEVSVLFGRGLDVLMYESRCAR